jgi:hypothetical protein
MQRPQPRAPKVAVLLGAGASADCWNDTGPPVNDSYRPPLARELFGTRTAFWDVLQRYNGARLLASELGELARGDAFNIEQKLREYAEHKDQRIRDAFREVPPYLRDLIATVVQSYTGGNNPGTHLRLVMNLLSTGAEVAFIDLNYDPYIESALAAFDPGLAIQSVGDYAAPGRQAIVCKAHGSIDWGVRMGGGRQAWHEALRNFEPQQKPVKIVLNRGRQTSTSRWVDVDQTPLYPVLTAPLAGKAHLDLVCPDQHLEALKAFLGDCGHYIVIGTSGQDEDLLEFLSKATLDHLASTAHYVSDTDKNAELTFQRMRVAVRAQRAIFIGAGFRRYLSSEPFQNLLTNLRR